MAEKMRSEPIGRAICKGLGVPAEMVYAVRLEVKAGDVLRAEVDFYPEISEEGLAEIVTALQQQQTVVDIAVGRRVVIDEDRPV